MTATTARAAQAGWRFHLTLIIVVALGYLVIRIVVAPTTGFLRNHATDLLAGGALPSVMALAIAADHPLSAWVRTLAGKIVLTLSAMMIWEVAMPLITHRSTPDPIDVLAYIGGTLIHHLATVAIEKRS